jgi:hypothetical protein
MPLLLVISMFILQFFISFLPSIFSLIFLVISFKEFYCKVLMIKTYSMNRKIKFMMKLIVSLNSLIIYFTIPKFSSLKYSNILARIINSSRNTSIFRSLIVIRVYLFSHSKINLGNYVIISLIIFFLNTLF